MDKEEQKEANINHDRGGELVVVSEPNRWFSYYYWFNDKKAPDFAKTVAIHNKPGYDPVELFFNSKKNIYFT